MKTKVLPIIAALFCSLGIVACGNGGVQQSSEATKHTHKWVADDGKQDVAATCSAEGVKYEKCSICGETRETKVSKKDHTWGEWVADNNAVCGAAGKEQRECSVCHTKEERSVGYIQHNWEVQSTVAAADGGLEYNLVKCSKCQKNGLMVAVKKDDGTNNMTVTGSPKTAPEGCVKLGANGDSMTAVIKLAAAKSGKLYIRGSMDYWYTSSNQNEQKGIFNGKSGGGADMENNKANFTMEVGPDADNLTEVTITSSHDLLYKDYLPEEVGFSDVSGTDWSQIGDIEVGNVSLAAGLNTIRFTRTDSYNIAVHDFVVAFDA